MASNDSLPDISSRREKMVWEIKKVYGLNSPAVLVVMESIPREFFAPKSCKDIAYKDEPVPIGFGQTMSQPYTVAFMTHLLVDKLGACQARSKKVLEIGTGSGYQAAILSKLFRKVYTLEVIPQLSERARKTLKDLGIKNVEVKKGSGEFGWEKHAPYDAIIVTAEVEKVPKDLFDQLKEGGFLVVPVKKGNGAEMMRYVKGKNSKIHSSCYGTFYFVPFVLKSNDKMTS